VDMAQYVISLHRLLWAPWKPGAILAVACICSCASHNKHLFFPYCRVTDALF
jgi:hypothetical protein